MSAITRKYRLKARKGYVALITVLILGAVGTLLSVTLLLASTTRSRTLIDTTNSYYARYYADACAEEALKEISLSTPYEGTDSLIFDNGDCYYSVINTGGQNRRIESEGSAGSVTKRLLIIIDSLNPTINVVSWQEVSNF